MQQLPHQHGGELHQLHDEPHGGERHRLQCVPQRRTIVSQGTSGAQGKSTNHVADHGGMLDLPQQHQHVERRDLRPRDVGHELHELSQRHDRDGHDLAAAHSDGDAPVQQLPHQHGGELHQLHDEPLGGERDSLRHLPFRRLCQGRHLRRAGPDLAAAHPDRDARMQQLPHRDLGLDRLYDEPSGGERGGVQHLPQRRLRQPGHVGGAGQRLRPRRHHRGMLDLSQEHDHLGRRGLRPCRLGHQLLELP